MTNSYYAHPYDYHASGFYFKSTEEFEQKYNNNVNEFGQPVEEYELHFSGGEKIDDKIFNDLSIHAGNIDAFIDLMEELTHYEKVLLYIAIKQGFKIDLKDYDPYEFDITLYEFDSMHELVEHFIEEGIYGDIPDNILCYLNYDQMAYELSIDYTETKIDGKNYIYRMA